CQNVVEWDGSGWNNLGGGIAGFASKGVVARSNLYLMGYFQLPADGIVNAACWDGQSWSALPARQQLPGQGLNPISAIAGDDAHLYVHIYDPNLSFSSSIFSWDGAQWTGLGSPNLFG